MVARSNRGGQGFRELRIELVPEPREGTFRVVVLGELGEFEATFVNPISAKDLSAALAAFPPTTKSLHRDVAFDSVDPVKDLGARLFDALFQGSVWRTYEAMRSRDEGMRIRIVAEGAGAQLPWELLYDRHREDFLVLSTRSPLVRQVGPASVASPGPPTPPLRMLAVVVDITGLVEGDQEIRRIRAADRRGLLEIQVLSGSAATYDRFLAKLAVNQFDIIHVMGYGLENGGTTPTRSSRPRQSLLFMPSEELARGTADGSPTYDAINERRLAAAFSHQTGLRLIVLNACFTDALAAGLGEVAPAVVGLRGVVTEPAAIAFSEGLYASLLEGNPLETAVTAGRLAIDSSEPGGREWSAPVFFLQTPSGDFLEGSGGAETVQVGGSVSASAASAGVAASRESQVATTLKNILDTNLAYLNAQVQQSSVASPTYLEEQVEATSKEVDRLQVELANLPAETGAEG